jgi:hypothetical protein
MPFDDSKLERDAINVLLFEALSNVQKPICPGPIQLLKNLNITENVNVAPCRAVPRAQAQQVQP